MFKKLAPIAAEIARVRAAPSPLPREGQRHIEINAARTEKAQDAPHAGKPTRP